MPTELIIAIILFWGFIFWLSLDHDEGDFDIDKYPLLKSELKESKNRK